jgi:hypothetical protein
MNKYLLTQAPIPTLFEAVIDPFSVPPVKIPWKNQSLEKVIQAGEVFSGSNVSRLTDSTKKQSYIFGGRGNWGTKTLRRVW